VFGLLSRTRTTTRTIAIAIRAPRPPTLGELSIFRCSCRRCSGSFRGRGRRRGRLRSGPPAPNSGGAIELPLVGWRGVHGVVPPRVETHGWRERPAGAHV